MINLYEVAETNKMVEQENLDVRTITLGISLLDCVDADLERCLAKIYEKITVSAKDLVKTGEEIANEVRRKALYTLFLSQEGGVSA